MFFEDVEKEYKLVASDIDELVDYCDAGTNHEVLVTPNTNAAIETLFKILNPLAPVKNYDAVKEIWIRVPKGINEECSEEFKWYKLTVFKYFDIDGKPCCYGLGLNGETVVSLVMKWRSFNEPKYFEEKAFEKLCEILRPAVEESIRLLQDGIYNNLIENELPYRYRSGVIKRSDLWKIDPKYKEEAYRWISDEKINRLKDFIASGENDEDRIGRIRDFTANDFFRACKSGYEAIGRDCEGFSLPELYIRYSDRRDEGLTSMGINPCDESGIDFTDPEAWDEWYFRRKQINSGHPFEVAPGYYHLYVWQDKTESETGGYYLNLVGSHWHPCEVISAFFAIKDTGVPISLSGAEAIANRLDGADYIGIIPIHMSEYEFIKLFPEEYGYIDDCIYADEVKDSWFDKIIWLPEEIAEILPSFFDRDN